ncbi:MAG: isoprenylcysteine carboxylmethyltransferase family protein [Thermodesulfovibrionales bacterium]|nr:isoprenylcysteine carboxylmethyltransferase family protein [Thermodesulfovibrionales bacterium]
MFELLALITIIFGVNIPLFWIPIHFYPHFFRKIGVITYLIPVITFSLISLGVYFHRDHILRYTLTLSPFLNLFGAFLFFVGIILHIWTAKLLSLWGLIGVPEILPKKKGSFVSSGPFSIIRHPTYFAHTLIFIGAFLLTEFIAVGILALFDFIMVHVFVIPFEERELLNRFGKVYEDYKKRVRWRVLPGLL